MFTKRLKKIVAVFLTLAFVFSSFYLTGCFLMDLSVKEIKFFADEMILELGSQKEIDSKILIITPVKAKVKDVTFTSSDETILAVDEVKENVVKAMSLGSVVLTASVNGGDFIDTIEVTVEYASVKGLNILYDKSDVTIAGGVIYKEKSDESVLNLTSQLTANVDPKMQVEWLYSFDGGEYVKSCKLQHNEPFAFDFTKVGSYQIIAQTATNENSSSYKDYQKINIYKDITDAEILINGSLVQKENEYGEVIFSLNYLNDTSNPSSIVEWFIDGELCRSENGSTFKFTPPSAGEYEISAKINGKPVLHNSQTFITVSALGFVIPQNVYLDFDNCYPKVFVRWNKISSKIGYKVSIINNVTQKEIAEEVNSLNQKYATRFTDSGVDVTDIFSAVGNTIFDATYTVKVKTFLTNNSDVESEHSEPYTLNKVVKNAEPFLKETYYDGNKNMYITSKIEFFDWFSYSRMWRTGIKNEEDLYLAFPFNDVENLINEAFKYDHFSGSYSFSFRQSGNKISIVINFLTDGLPSIKTPNTSLDINNWGSIRPHINYDDANGLPASYEFPIKRRKDIVVDTSEQLYYVVEKGYNPVPMAGSKAEILYSYAKRLLKNILTESMTEVDKAHAIYDWIMWRVTYDEKFSDTDSEQSVKYESFYLESVLTDSAYFSVCDGISKAYSLLCNMVGIPCMRVTGHAGSGGHAWNKLKIDGNWYIADCTWGDKKVSNGYEGQNVKKELADHIYFLVADGEVPTHAEENKTKYPPTPVEGYNWYDDDIAYNGEQMDFYIDSGITMNKEINLLAQYIKYNAINSSPTYSVGPDKNIQINKTTTKYYACEIKILESFAQLFNDSSFTNPLVRAFNTINYKLGKDYNVTVLKSYNSIILVVFVKY